MSRSTMCMLFAVGILAAFFAGKASGEARVVQGSAFKVVSDEGKLLAELGQREGRPFIALYGPDGKAVWKASVDGPPAKKKETPDARKPVLARTQMKELMKALQFYYLDQGQWPETLEELTEVTDDWPEGYISKIPLDPWGGKYYLLRSDDPRRAAPASPGPDGKPKTDDDVFLK